MPSYISPLLAGLLAVISIPLVACGSGKGNNSKAVSIPSSGFVLLGAASAPANTVGKDGDYFLNNATGQVYGPKTNGAWPAKTLTLSGPAGPTGPEGLAGHSAGSVLITGFQAPQATYGRDGDFYLDLGNLAVYGPKATDGAWPHRGRYLAYDAEDADKYDDRRYAANGANGANGAYDADYVDGAEGAEGADGTRGDYMPDNAADADGPMGGTGAWGPKGPTSDVNAGAVRASYFINNLTPGGKALSYLKPDTRTNTFGEAGVVATSSCEVANFSIHWIGPVMDSTSSRYTFEVMRFSPTAGGSSPGNLLAPQLQCEISSLAQHCSMTVPVRVLKNDVLQVEVKGDQEFTALPNGNLLLGSLTCQSAVDS